MKMSRIEKVWESLRLEGNFGGSRLVDPEHPLALYGTVDSDDRPALLLVTSVAPPPQPELDVVRLSSAPRSDGKVAVVIRLVAPSLEGPFAHICEDLIDSSWDVPDPEASAFLVARLARWRRLLRGKHQISHSELRGLIGELVVVRDSMDRWPPGLVVDSWLGPLDSAQDLILPTCRIETKAVMPDARAVRISSADQLDHEPDLLLAVVTLVTLGSSEEGLTLDGFIQVVRDKLETSGETQANVVLDSRLFATGYLLDGSLEGFRFRVDDVAYYRSGAGFPAIPRQWLPAGVIEIRYDISLSALANYRTEPPVA
jgi:hypothetical protein